MEVSQASRPVTRAPNPANDSANMPPPQPTSRTRIWSSVKSGRLEECSSGTGTGVAQEAALDEVDADLVVFVENGHFTVGVPPVVDGLEFFDFVFVDG